MKKILIALVSVAFLVGCSADGIFTGSSLESPGVTWSSNDDDGPSTGSTIKCLLPSGVCMEIPKATCTANKGDQVSQCPSNPPQPVGDYCYDGNDCDKIGGNYIKNASQCTQYGGEIKTFAQCKSLGADIEGEDYN